MIHVEPQPEPDKFDKLVRQPGRKFLSQCPKPKGNQWRPFWKKIAPDLQSAYGSICSYSCHFIQYDTGWRTVEHFKPKDDYPSDAYEWSNYRLVCGVLNGRKGKRIVLDPFEIGDGWFVMDFPSLLVKPAQNLDEARKRAVSSSCEILGLNDEGSCMNSRQQYVKDYCKGEITFDYLRRNAPFIAAELQRQNLVEEIRNIMIYS
jgi:hypothetical protein